MFFFCFFFYLFIYLLLQFKHLTGSTADTFLEYIQRNLPEGMAMKVTRVSRSSIIVLHIYIASNRELPTVAQLPIITKFWTGP